MLENTVLTMRLPDANLKRLDALGDVVGSLKAESDLIIGALDLLFARF